MASRSTWILLALALLLGGYVWFVEIRGKEREAEAEEAARDLVGLEIDALTAIDLRTSDAQDARLERAEAGGWALVRPVQYPVDTFNVERLTDALDGLTSKSAIDPAPSDRVQFGLGPEAPRLVLHAGEESLEITLGKRAPVGAARYLQVSSQPGKIFVVDYAGTSPLEPDLVGLRDKRISTAKAEDVRWLVVRITDGAEVRVERDGDDWRMTAPLEGRADGERIERVIGDLELARASDFADEPGDLAAYGLAPPLASLEVGLAEGEPLRLNLGRTEDAAWVERPGESALLQVRDRVVDGLPREAFEYRYKRVLRLDDPALGALELRFPRDEVAYRFVREDHEWRAGDASIRVESLEVADLVFAIEELDATGVEPPGTALADLGLEPARVRVTLFDAGGDELAWLELGDPHPERGLAARSSQGDGLWRVRNELGEDVPLSLDAFRNDFAEVADDDAG